MSEREAVQGLTCPKCGGIVPIPEGQQIVRCPYCELRSFVRGERGLLRFQVPQRVQKENCPAALRSFFASSWAIARDAARSARLVETFLVYLPFWTVWGRAAAWAFGQKKVGSGDNAHYEPREVRLVQEMTWDGAACDVGEFGVNQVLLTDQELEPFNPDELHRSGMVFEPAGSFAQAKSAAENQFQDQVRSKVHLDRLAQLFVRFFRTRYGMVYYPLWVLRYLYRGRSFQVVVDGYSGKVLYGKAPGNTLYRAAVLVGGMAVGAFLALDAPAFLLSTSSKSSDSPLGLAIILFLVGLGIMFAAYRAFRYGEQYEKRSPGGRSAAGSLPFVGGELDALEIGNIKIKDVEQWIERLS